MAEDEKKESKPRGLGKMPKVSAHNADKESRKYQLIFAYSWYTLRLNQAINQRIATEKEAIAFLETNIASYRTQEDTKAKERLREQEARLIIEKALLAQYQDIQKAYMKEIRESVTNIASPLTAEVYMCVYVKGMRDDEICVYLNIGLKELWFEESKIKRYLFAETF